MSPLQQRLKNPDFLSDFFGQKHLYIPKGLPQVLGELEPGDVLELCLADQATSRLLTQDSNDNWQLHCSPLDPGLVEETLADGETFSILVQNLESWSLPIAQLWSHFDMPHWLQDDIMVSYAPPGGSVGAHFDAYDVFLVQLHGHRHWKLGGFADSSTPLRADQPISLVEELGEVVFDQLCAPGDVLYVPPGQIHHGVATDHCLTLSFGLRSASAATLLDHVLSELSNSQALIQPLLQHDHTLTHLLKPGAALSEELVGEIKQKLMTLLEQSNLDQWSRALGAALSTRRFEWEADPESEPTPEELIEALNSGYVLIKEPAQKLLITEQPEALFCAGEQVSIADPAELELLKRLALGESLTKSDLSGVDSESIMNWLDLGLITLSEP